MQPDTLKAIEQHHRSHPEQRMQSLYIDGRKVWLKRAGASKETKWHTIQRALTALIPIPIFRSTASTDGRASLQQEAARLRLFNKKGIRVPAVVALMDDLLVLEDGGLPLRDHLNGLLAAGHSPLPVLQAAALVLAQLHNVGLCHGRPLLKDMTWQDGKIGLLDLEEDPLRAMTLPEAQARDIWLFLNGAAQYTGDDLDALREIYGVYAQQVPQETLRTLQKMVRFLRPFRFLAEHLVIPFAGKDVHHAVYANKALETK